MKRGAPRHPKFYEALRLLKIPQQYEAVMVGYLELLWHFTAEFATQGNIGKYSDERIEAAMRWHGTPGRLIEALVNTGWIDRDPSHRLVVHDWHDHCDQNSHKRLLRAGLQFLTIREKVTVQRPDMDSLPLPVPLPVPVPSASAARNGSSISSKKEPITPAQKEFAERIYQRHPKKKNLPAVFNAIQIALQINSNDEIDKCHAAWCKSEEWTKENGKYCPQLAAWLTDRGFTIWPPEIASGKPTLKFVDPLKEKKHADTTTKRN